ncbi:hypothetical protein [Caulobacter sp. 17J80-11]|uniref:hypothetical protein n=1 Tax=Caulobacter sp. 17J80-11 TaxID=2763502 RepID=UPI001653EB33|nr:hypothetical protein [Caulobacter sp. 17J80-11]MBC6981400.1 hypothetical protein [Caulobacter sp. 17J80-11]
MSADKRKFWPAAVLLVVFALVAGSGFASALSIAGKAARVAGGRAYCLQVGERTGYRPVLGLIDLARFTTGSPHALRYHAVLAVQEPGDWRLYNWSYRSWDWDPLPAVPTLRCVPRARYADRLTWRRDRAAVAQPRDYFARLGTKSYVVPAGFRALADADDPASLYFDARGGEFEKPHANEQAPGPGYWRVGVEFRSRLWIESLVEGKPALALTASPPPPTGSPATYVARDGQGQVRTVILCSRASALNPAPCQHWFYADDAMWSFRQTVADLPNWERLEANLRRRVGSFEAAGARCEAGVC